MQMLVPFALHRPSSASEAAALLARPGARALAGGTDLIVNLRRGIERPATLVDLCGVPGLDALRWSDAGLELGACVTLARLAAEAQVREALPALAHAAQSVAAPGHRSSATVGGNLCLDTRCVYYNQSEAWRSSNGYCLKRGGSVCHVAPRGRRCLAAYSGDLAAVLLAMEASVELFSPSGSRRVPLEALYRDDGAAHLALAPGEFLASVRIPPGMNGLRVAYRKLRARGAIDFPLAGVAVALAGERARLSVLRVALTGTNSRPLVLDGTAELIGKPVDDALLAKLARLVQKQASPMRTTTTASNYRRQVAAAAAQRLVRELVA